MAIVAVIVAPGGGRCSAWSRRAWSTSLDRADEQGVRRAHDHHAPPANKPLLTQTSTSGTSASYSIPFAFYSVTVSTSTERSWVSISPAGQRPAFEGILERHPMQHQVLLGPSTIEIGAGGTTVTVTFGKHSEVLKPPAAPLSYTITPKT